MSVVGRFQFPKTGFKGEIRIANPNPFIAVSLSPYRVHIFHCDIIGSPIAIVSCPCKIDSFEIEGSLEGNLTLWLVCGQDIFYASFSPDGAVISNESSISDRKATGHSKKRPHSSDGEVPTSKRATPSKIGNPNQISHRVASLTRSIDATFAKRIKSLAYVKSSAIGSFYQTFSESICYYTSLSPNDWGNNFFSRLEPSEQISDILICSSHNQSNMITDNPKRTQIPSSLSKALYPESTTSDIGLVATSFGRILISPLTEEAKLSNTHIRILSPLANHSIICISTISQNDKSVGLIIIGSNGMVVIMTETANHLRTRKFQLSLPITSACVVNDSIIFISDASVFISRISQESTLILLGYPEKQLPTRLARRLVHVHGTSKVLLYCCDQVIIEMDLKNMDGSQKRAKEATEMISNVLALLEDVSEQQEAIQEQERQVDDLIMHVNTGMHAGTIKNQFGVRIVPKIEPNRISMSISLSIPHFLTSLQHWSLTLSFNQSTSQWSHSIPLTVFQAQKKTSSNPSAITLNYRLELPFLSLHPLNVRSYVNFHFSEINLPFQCSNKTQLTSFLSSLEDPRVTVFIIGEQTFDALDLSVRTKRIAPGSSKIRKHPFHFQLRHILQSNIHPSIDPLDSSPNTMDINLSRWSFITWLDWKAIPEAILLKVFGNVMQANNPVASISTISEAKSSASTISNGIQIPLEAITGALGSIHLRPLSDADRTTTSHFHRNIGKSVSMENLACIVSIQSNPTELKQLRAALLSRIRTFILSGSPEPCTETELSCLKTYTKGFQAPWKRISSLEVLLLNLKAMRVQLNQSVSTSSTQHSHSVSHVLSLSEALKTAGELQKETDALYWQLRQTIGDQFAI